MHNVRPNSGLQDELGWVRGRVMAERVGRRGQVAEFRAKRGTASNSRPSEGIPNRQLPFDDLAVLHVLRMQRLAAR